MSEFDHREWRLLSALPRECDLVAVSRPTASAKQEETSLCRAIRTLASSRNWWDEIGEFLKQVELIAGGSIRRLETRKSVSISLLTDDQSSKLVSILQHRSGCTKEHRVYDLQDLNCGPGFCFLEEPYWVIASDLKTLEEALERLRKRATDGSPVVMGREDRSMLSYAHWISRSVEKPCADRFLSEMKIHTKGIFLGLVDDYTATLQFKVPTEFGRLPMLWPELNFLEQGNWTKAHVTGPRLDTSLLLLFGVR